MENSTTTKTKTYTTLEAAARAYGKGHGVLGRAGGWLYKNGAPLRVQGWANYGQRLLIRRQIVPIGPDGQQWPGGKNVVGYTLRQEENSTTPAPTAVAIDCPACGGKRSRTTEHGPRVYRCERCGCIHGSCTLGESYAIVLPTFSDREDMDGGVPYDLQTLGSGVLRRRHGIFDPKTRLILQVG